MKRLVLATLLVALAWSIADAARPVTPVEIHDGTWRVEYWAANGPEPARLTAAQYADFVRSRSCLPRSHVAIWPRDRTIQLICEV